MPIQSGSLIDASEIRDYIETKGGITNYTRHGEASYTAAKSMPFSFDAWMRRNPVDFNYDFWDVGTTYSEGDNVLYGASAYRSLEDSNIGEAPGTGEAWDRRWGSSIYPAHAVLSSAPSWSNDIQSQTARYYAGSSVYSVGAGKLFDFTTYSALTTYDYGDKVYDATEDAYFISLTGTNLGNPLSDTDNWSCLIRNYPTTCMWNLFISDKMESTSSSRWFIAYRVTFDANQDRILTPVYSLPDTRSGSKQTLTGYMILEPGLYFLMGRHKAFSPKGDSTFYVITKPYDHTMQTNDKIRVMKSDWSDLEDFGQTEVTTTLTKNGYLSHIGFEGGVSPE